MSSIPRVAPALAAFLIATPLSAQTRPMQPMTMDPTPATTPITYSVVYTGRLFGYFRHPAEQDELMRLCSQIDQPESGPAAEFMKTIAELAPQKPPAREVRVAVGDNFAPFLLARTMKFSDPEEGMNGQGIGKDLLAFDDKWVLMRKASPYLDAQLAAGRGTIPFDNVACFLRRAQFDAIVPGKQDFYYGAERLRQLAALLAKPTDDRFAPVQILAANLSITTKDNTRTPLPPRHAKPDGYETTTAVVKGATPVLPQVVLPWLRRIRIEKAIQVASVEQNGAVLQGDLDELLTHAEFPAAELERAAAVSNSMVTINDTVGRRWSISPNMSAAMICPADRQRPNGVILPEKRPGGCTRLVPVPLPANQATGKLTLDRMYRIPEPGSRPSAGDIRAEFAIPADNNHAVCLSPATGTKPYCRPFTVHAPFFEYSVSLAPVQPGCVSSTNGSIRPYALKQGPDGVCVAIFGVVDPSLREYVGALNDSWLNVHPKTLELEADLETEVQVSDPVEALTQLLQYCEADPACSTARKILLAHMPRAKASQIAARFKTGMFDLVVAQSDYDRASGTLESRQTVSFGSAGGVNEVSEPVVLVPGAHFTPTVPDTIRVRLQRAVVTITPGTDAKAASEERKIVNTAKHGNPVVVPPLPSLEMAAAAQTLFAWIGAAPFARPLPALDPMHTRAAKTALLHNLALLTMRDHCRADVALMQGRDVFFSPPLAALSLDEAALRLALDAVYWKGDFVICRTLTGATIKQLLARSRELSAAESNAVFGELEFGRSLVQVGALPDPNSGEYVISGQFIDDKKIYSVATTDFVAEGDTGYAVLQSAAPKAAAIDETTRLNRLSALVYQALLGRELRQEDAKLLAVDYLDSSSHQPFDTTRLTQPRQAADWWVEAVNPNDPVKRAPPLAASAQQHSFWSVSLESASVSYSTYRHDLSEKAVDEAFGGSPISQLTANEKESVGFDLQVRLKRSAKWGDWYSAGGIDSQRDETHEDDDEDGTRTSISAPKNQLVLEHGLLFNLPSGRNPSTFKVLTAALFETQLTTPFLNVKLKDDRKVQADVPRDYFAAAKLGVRREFRDSAVEAGGLLGNKYHSATKFTFIPANRTDEEPVECEVTLGKTISKCVEKKLAGIDRRASAENVTLRNHKQFGVFANARLHFPLPFGRLKFLSEETFQRFFDDERDVEVDTRYLVTWKNAIEVPVWGNLSLAPTVEWFFYKNKVNPRRYRSERYSVDFKYSFNRQSGMRWADALAYPSPPSK